MRVAIIVQRYGEEIVGGAEYLARQYAERMVSQLGWQVDVLTTTARDYRTWKGEYEIRESEVLNGVTIYRFPATFGRLHRLQRVYGKIVFGLNQIIHLLRLKMARPFIHFLAVPWYWLQGPVVPSLIRRISRDRDRYDRFYFFTYLYYPSVFGLPKVANKSILVTTAHDEPPFYLPNTERLLRAARVIFANIEPEERLLHSVLPTEMRGKIHLVGTGFNQIADTKDNNLSYLDYPYFLYLGRLSRGKGVDVLIQDFLDSYARFDLGRVKLVLVGKLDDQFEIPDDPRIVFLGFVDENRKSRLLKSAAALINPSRYESLSLVVIEAIAHEVPVIVNQNCPVLNFYREQLETVFGFSDSTELASQMKLILSNKWGGTIDEQRAKLKVSSQWVHNRFSWNIIMEKIRAI